MIALSGAFGRFHFPQQCVHFRDGQAPVRAHRAMGEDRAEVEFVARYRLGGRAVRLHVRSRFVREGGRWYYVDGDQF